MNHFPRIVAFLGLVVLNSTSYAIPILNPAPGVLGNDIDGSGYFTPGSSIFSVEVADVFGGTFGFYFQSTDVNLTGNLIPIFQPNDARLDEAVVNFASGIVIDVEDAAVQNTFTGTGNIGFYLTLHSLNGLTLFSDPSLNSGNTDWMGTFPLLSSPTAHSLWFTGPQGLVGAYNVSNLTPVSVPEPSILLLLATGLCSMLLFALISADAKSSPGRFSSDEPETEIYHSAAGKA